LTHGHGHGHLDPSAAKIFGTQNERDVKAIRPLIAAINALEPEVQQLSDIDLAAKTIEFKEKLAQGATLDDHRFWVQRLSTMAKTMVAAGLAILALMIIATALSVVFATRGAMAGNRDVVEVLHFVGAHDSFIANEFQRHFLWLGLKGGIIGGGAAALTFSAAHMLATRFIATAGGDQVEALFGSFVMDWRGYAAIVGAVVLIALITGVTSRVTVHHVLRGQL